MARYNTTEVLKSPALSSLGGVMARNVQTKQPQSPSTSAPRSSNRVNQRPANPREQMARTSQDYAYEQNYGANYGVDYDTLAEARRKALLDRLNAQYNQGLADIESMRPDIQQRYAQERTAAAVSGQQEQRRLGESLAARGVTSSGEGREAYAQQYAATQGRLGDLSTAEQSALSQLDKQKADLIRQRDAAISQGLSEIDIKLIEEQIAQSERDRQFLLAEAGLTGTYRGRDTLAGRQLGLQAEQMKTQTELAEAGLTGTYRGQQTMQGRQSVLAEENARISNEAAQLQLSALPDKIKNEAALIQQQLKQGQLGIEQAQYQLNQLKDPKSIYNQMQALELQAKKLGNVALSKQIAQIGRRPPVDPLDQRKKQLQIQAMEMELQNARGAGGVDTTKYDKGLETVLGRLGDLSTRDEINKTALNYIKNLSDNGVDEKIVESMLIKNGFPATRK